MRLVVSAATSPLNCRWIKPGTRDAIEGFEYAVCRRHGDAERVVSEAECMYCPAWEAPRPFRSLATFTGDPPTD